MFKRFTNTVVDLKLEQYYIFYFDYARHRGQAKKDMFRAKA